MQTRSSSWIADALSNMATITSLRATGAPISISSKINSNWAWDSVMTVKAEPPFEAPDLNMTGGRANVPAKKIDELDLHSEHVQEVLGVPPRWLVRWGSTVVFAIVVALVELSWILQYPDVIPASLFVTTPTPPSRSPS